MTRSSLLAAPSVLGVLARGSALALSLVACSKPVVPPSAVPVETRSRSKIAWTDSPTLELDFERMRKDIAYFSSDELAGRYTLSKSINRARDWLRESYQSQGIQSAVGKDYLHRYSLPVSVREKLSPHLEIRVKGQRFFVPTSAYSSCAFGSSGAVSGPLLFVGYGIEQSGMEGGLREVSHNNPKGKVALLMSGAPGDYDAGRIAERAELLAELYDSKMQASAHSEREEVYLSARRAMLKKLSAFLSPADLPKEYLSPKRPFPSRITGASLVEGLWDALEEVSQERRLSNEVQLREKLRDLKRGGAIAAIVIRPPNTFLDADDSVREELPPLNEKDGLTMPEPVDLPTIYLKQKVANQWLSRQGLSLAELQKEIDLSHRARSVLVPGLEAQVKVHLEFESQEASNVLAVVPGTDLFRQIVVVGAHYDHIGTASESPLCEATEIEGKVDTICNGADDNASGTIAILEIARALKKLPQKPRRTIVFAHFSGEELGLLGSKALVQDRAIDPGRIVAMINIDMIGRLGQRELKVGGISTSASWLELLEESRPSGLRTLYDKSSTSRSDHAAFVDSKIPALFFFSGVHDQYHQPGDDVDGLDFGSYRKISSMIAELVVKLAFGAPVLWTEPPQGEGVVPELPGENPRMRVVPTPRAAG